MANKPTIQGGTTSRTNLLMAKNNKNMAKFSYWLGGIDVTQQNLDQFDPYIQGVSRFFVYKLPYFMEKGFEDLSKRFKSYLEVGYRSISGIQGLEVQFVEFEGGFANQKFSNVSGSQDNTDTVTINVYELSGSPIREFLDTWITGVRDPRSGIAHYHGMLDEGVSYSEKNHTAEFIYFTLDPTARKIEYACLLAHCFPQKSDKDHLNYETGRRENVEIEIEMRCTKYESRYINDVAAFFLGFDTIKYSYLDFNPHITEANVRASNTTFIGAE